VREVVLPEVRALNLKEGRRSSRAAFSISNASLTDAYDRLFFSNNEYFRLSRTGDGMESGG
jgi:hypothetical protein